MSIGSLLFAQLARLPRPEFRTQRQRVKVTTRDGITLETLIFSPRSPGSHPTVLTRVPYGLRGFDAIGEVFAERGFRMLVQACRGTGGSGGSFDPLRNERNDGLDTLAWLEEQPWYDGRLGLFGVSYLGYAGWAIADQMPQHSAMISSVTSSEFRSIVFPGGAFHLGLWLNWMQVVDGIGSNPWLLADAMRGEIERRTEAAALTLPLREADVAATGHPVAFWRDWFDRALVEERFWDDIDHQSRIGAGTPPNHFISGWYDFMLDQLLRDYKASADAGLKPYLTVGPWFHISMELQAVSVQEALHWMRAHLLDDRTALREKPVRIYIQGADVWREFDAYPPEPRTGITFNLLADKHLGTSAPDDGPPSTYRYDPADPTPNLGGAEIAFYGAGPVDNAPLEGRADVLAFTSAPMSTPVTMIGQVQARIFIRSSIGHADLFVRLCDVNPGGRSTNICDGYLRLAPEAGNPIREVMLTLHATAHQFRRAHRLRVLVASGAHPRYARNMGTDEEPGTATTLVPADIEIFHDPEHPSGITLPVFAL